MLKKFMVMFLLFFTLSCSLERNNPLDPSHSGIQAPNKVTGINISVTEENVLIQWDAMNPNYLDGYYIYRSQTYDGLYSIIFEPDKTDSLYEDIDVIIPPNFYWYKMSAFKEIPGTDKYLEGYRSEPKIWSN